MSSISEPVQLAPQLARHTTGQDRVARMVFWLISTAWRATTENAHALISRFTGHLVFLALVVSAVMLSGLWAGLDRSTFADANQPARFALSTANQLTPTPATSLGPRLESNLSSRGQTWRTLEVESVSRAAVPFTQIPQRLRRSIITYTVQAGDTAEGIAYTFDIKPETIMWSNPAVEDTPDYLQIGQVLVILPINGVYHTVAKNDTLDSIAKKYKAKVESITGVSFNNLTGPDYKIEPGMKLIVEGGEKPFVPKVVTTYSGPVPQDARGTGRFYWPTSGTLTQGYWWGHRAADIGAALGMRVNAADSGFVSFAGWTDVGYGKLVVIDHANGYATYYAHLNTITVAVGQRAVRGQPIGTVGSTGNSTGPHLHFEIRLNGSLLNPLVYLR